MTRTDKMCEQLFLRSTKTFTTGVSSYFPNMKYDEMDNKINNNITDKSELEFVRNLWEGREIPVHFDKLDDLNLEPDWLDLKKIKKGQEFARDFYLAVSGSETVNLILGFTYEKVLRKLIWTGKSSDAYTSFKRYLSTGNRVRSWFVDDLLDEKTEGFKNLRRVNQIHGSFYNRLQLSDRDSFLKSSEIADPKSSVCPFLLEDLKNSDLPLDIRDLPEDKFPISQMEMAGTQFAFVSFLVLYPESFGVCPVKYREDLEAFVHLWRYIGYRLGTTDSYNLCSGTLRQVQIKCKTFVDLIIKPSLKTLDEKWEHMSRSLIEGIQYYTGTFSFEVHLMFGLDLIEVGYERLYRHSSFKTKLELLIFKLINRYLLSIDWIRNLITKLLLKKINEVSSNMPTLEEFNRKNKYKNHG